MASSTSIPEHSPTAPPYEVSAKSKTLKFIRDKLRKETSAPFVVWEMTPSVHPKTCKYEQRKGIFWRRDLLFSTNKSLVIWAKL
jgi:hypothetical protein